MASSMCLFASPIMMINHKNYISSSFNVCKPIRSSQSTSMPLITSVEPESVVRRSANYDPTLWSFDHIQSLSSKYTGQDCVTKADSLKEEVRKMIHNVVNISSTLELVDDLQRLGIAYHFEDEIDDVLKMIYDKNYRSHDEWDTMDLNLKALGFRLLRQHCFHVPQEIFSNFEEKAQNLKPDSIDDMVSVLNLYEASYHSFEDESILDDARDFATKYLKEHLGSINGGISSLVSHALEFPLHWRVPRIEAKWFIDVYEKRSSINHTVLELAKLDFDMVQPVHLEELKHTSRWWKNTRLDEKLSFARDRLVEHFMWALGFGYQPQFSLERKIVTMVNSLITAIDDIYDVYGTLDELERFTDIIDRWDVNEIKELPDYMKISFFAFYNSINEIGYSILTETGLLVLPYIKQAWANHCKSYLVEAKWYHSGYTPTLKEYLDNAYVSIGGPVILFHVNCLRSFDSTEEMLQCVERAENIIRYSSLLFRLTNDLGTSPDEMARGDISKSIQCYMHENGATEEEARTYIKSLISDTWKKLNKERACAHHSHISRRFIDCATNIPRMSQFMYSEGDGHGHPDIIRSHVLSLLFNPIHGVK